MGISISILSGKGGVGKTTVAANLGTVLAMSGRKVVLLDADIGLKNLDIILGLENRVVYDICDVIYGRCVLKSALVRDKRTDGLYLLAASQSKCAEEFSPDDLRDIVTELKKSFDYVIVDGPAGVGRGFENALLCSDAAIVVTCAEVSAVRDADRVCGIIGARGIFNFGIIVNRVKRKLVRRGSMLSPDDISDILSENLLGMVYDDPKMSDATNKGEVTVKKSRSRLTSQYKSIAVSIENSISECMTECENMAGAEEKI